MEFQSLMNTTPRKSALVLATAAVGFLALPASAAPPAPLVHCGSSQLGMSLAEWQELYFRWDFGDIILSTDENGNEVAGGGGNVVLMPLPDASGDGTPASLDVKLRTGQGFVLPLWVWLGTSYDDGRPDDEPVDMSIFTTLNISFKINGVTIVSSSNVLDYYSEFAFEPPIALPPIFSPFQAIIFYQGVGVVHTPLPPGDYTITLDVVNTMPLEGQFIEYHNTWYVTVEPGK